MSNFNYTNQLTQSSSNDSKYEEIPSHSMGENNNNNNNNIIYSNPRKDIPRPAAVTCWFLLLTIQVRSMC